MMIRRKIGMIASLVGMLYSLYTPVYGQNTGTGIAQVTYEDSSTGIVAKLKQSYTKTEQKKPSGELEFVIGEELNKFLKVDGLKLRPMLGAKSDLREVLYLGAGIEAEKRIGSVKIGTKLYSYLNTESSKNHLSYNPYMMIDLGKGLSMGIWDLGKYNLRNKTGFDYVGPFAVLSLTKNICLTGHYGWDIHNKENRLIYLKLDFMLGK